MSKNVNITITGDSSSAQKALKDTQKSAEQLNDAASESVRHSRNMKQGLTDASVGAGALTSKLGPLGVALGVGLGLALTKAVGAISNFVKESQKAFADFEQNLGGTQVVFGQFAKDVVKSASTSADNIGVSTSQYLQTANIMGSLFKGAGYSTQQAMEMTTGAIQRATDVASVMGITAERALESVSGMAKGNLTMMDNLGVAMTNASLQAYALQNGITASVDAMTTAERVGLAYQMFLDRTTDYAGNFAREGLNTVTGALQVANANMENAKTILGAGLAPVMMMVADFVKSTLVPAIIQLAPAIAIVIAVIKTFIGILLAMFQAVARLFGGGNSSTAKASADTSKMATNSQKISTGLGGGAKNAKSIAKSAQEAKDALAGFDKVKVLKQDTGSAGGGGGSDVGAGGGGGGVEIPAGNIGDIEGMADALGGMGEALKKVQDTIKNNAFVKWLEGLVKWFKESEVGQAVLAGLAIAVGILVVALGAYAVVMAIVNLVSSPIFLIILAIVAAIALLIAIIIIVVKNWDTIIEAFKVGWNWLSGVFVKIWDTLVNAFKSVVNAIWSFLKPAIDAVVAVFEFVWAIVSKVIEIYMKIYEIIFTLLIVAFKAIWSVVSDVFTKVWNFIAEVFGKIVKVFEPITTFFGNIFKQAWENIKSAFGAVAGFFQGVWNTITGIFGKVGEVVGDAIGGAFKTVVNGVINIVSGVVNTVIDLINGAIKLINKLPGVSISPIGRLTLPKMAKGGVVNGATMAMIGEAGAEAVVPLENNTGWTDKVAGLLNNSMGNGKPMVIENIIELNGTELGRAIVEILNDRTNATGFNGLTL